MKFSIITVCYNEEKGIQATIESVLKQGWKDYEYIIVDGKSSDRTMEIVCKYAEKETQMRWYSERDKGIYNAMNKGIQYAEGDYIYFLNAGDTLCTNNILDGVAETIRDSNADIVFGDIMRRLESGQISISAYCKGEDLRSYLSKRKNICHQAIFASRESLKCGFDEQFKICADYDWLCRQVIMGRKTTKVNSIIVDFDIHGVSSQACYQKLELHESLEVVRKYFPEMDIWKYDEVEDLLFQNKKNRMLYRYMNQWLALRQRNVKLSSFFVDRKLYTIAIYGFHYMGQRLYDELKNSPVTVAYVVDKKVNMVTPGLPVVQSMAKLEDVDAIIVTPIFDFFEIRDDLAKKIECRIISIEEVLGAIT